MKKLVTIIVIMMVFASYSSGKSLKKSVKYQVIEATATKVNNLGTPESYAAIIKIGKEYFTSQIT